MKVHVALVASTIFALEPSGASTKAHRYSDPVLAGLISVHRTSSNRTRSLRPWPSTVTACAVLRIIGLNVTPRGASGTLSVDCLVVTDRDTVGTDTVSLGTITALAGLSILDSTLRSSCSFCVLVSRLGVLRISSRIFCRSLCPALCNSQLSGVLFLPGIMSSLVPPVDLEPECQKHRLSAERHLVDQKNRPR